jgi:glutamate:GABA antiporter
MRREIFMDVVDSSKMLHEVTTQAVLEEKKKLRKELRLFDLVFISIAAIVSIDTLGVVSSQGGQALIWLLISAVTYFVPYGLLAAELGSTFTQEGGVYEWCKLAGGRFYAGLTAMLYWISNPLWLGGTLAVTAIVAIKTLWFGNPNIKLGGSTTTDAIFMIVIGLIFIWVTMWCAIVTLRSGKWLSIFGSYVKIALLVLFAILALAYAFGGHATGEHISFSDLTPTTNVLAIITVILPALVFNWGGFEVQNGAGEEMRRPQRDVPLSILRSGIVAIVAYTVLIAAVLFTLPKNQLSNASGFLATFQIVIGNLPSPLVIGLSWVVAVGIFIALSSNGGTWIIGGDRVYAIAALDRAAPVQLGRFSKKYGTPIAVNVLSGIVATIAMVGAVLVSESNGGNVSTLFTLVLGFTISTTTLSYMLIFPAFLLLRYKYPHVPRTYRVPGGLIGAWIVTVLPFLYAALSSYFILIPIDSTVSNSGVSRLTYELTVFIPLAIIVLLSTGLYIWGHAQKHNQDIVIDLPFQQEGTVAVDADVTESPVTGD